MQASMIRNIQPGTQFTSLFPEAGIGTQTILKNAGVDDTVAFIPKVVHKTLYQTAGIASRLKGKTLIDTCKNIWSFVYQHIAYRKDKDGYEQIRSPARTWHDRQQGVDCDCYSTFISSILTNLRIPHKLRITKYHKDYYQHIYPIVPTGNGHIIIDCVTDQFNYQVPFSEKKDYDMDLQFLNGFGNNDYRGDDIIFNGIGSLGRTKKRKGNALPANPDDPNAVPATGVKKKKGLFKKIISKVNKVNPAMILLRNGVLAAMKLNLFRVASRLKYSYISPNDAAKRKILPDRFKKLVAVRQKLENIFYGAGGKPENLRKAILKGKGNHNKDVAVFGLGFLDIDTPVLFMDSSTPLPQLLGADLYHSENIDGMEGFGGFGELGEPATAAALASATAVIAGLSKILKSVGNIFGGGAKGSEDFSDDVTAAADQEVAASPAASSSTKQAASSDNTSVISPAITSEQSISVTNKDDDFATENVSTSVSTANAMLSADSQTKDGSPVEGFWPKNKKWLLPVSIGVGGLTAIALAMHYMKPHPPNDNKPLSGLPAQKKNHRRKPRPATRKKRKYPAKASVILL